MNHKPEILELIAKNILLSKGGSVKAGPEDITFYVTDKNGATSLQKVSSIHFSPGWPQPWLLCFQNGKEALVTNEDDLLKVWDYVVKNHVKSDRDILIGKETLKTLLRLRERNILFIVRHGDLTEGDVLMAEDYRRVMEAKRAAVKGAPIPFAGDTVEGVYYEGGEPFTNGVIESNPHCGKELSVCARPYVPFVYYRDGERTDIGLSVSGGPFFGINSEDLEYVGPHTRWFCDWGHDGRCAHGSVEFPVTVNRWRIKPNVKI